MSRRIQRDYNDESNEINKLINIIMDTSDKLDELYWEHQRGMCNEYAYNYKGDQVADAVALGKIAKAVESLERARTSLRAI